jgi:GT2 family glycosyltransferase
MLDISIVIPNWNGQHFLEVCFNSIAEQTGGFSIETILVDNKSSDNSASYTREKYPWVKVIELTHNTGFAQGVNEGIKVAESPLIALLNNDTELDPGWVAALISAGHQYPEVGFFATKMLDFKDRTIIDTCGDILTWSGRSYKSGEGKPDGPPYTVPRLVFGACAGASAYRRELFDTIGLFDETFFAYLEDVDIDLRAQLAGFTCLFVPEARVYHIGSATAGKKSAFGFKMMVKNHFHLIYKNYSNQLLLRHSGKIVYAEARLLGAAFKHHFVKEYFWGIAQAFKELPIITKKRAEVQKLRTVSDAYLNTVIEPNFPYKPLQKALFDHA